MSMTLPSDFDPADYLVLNPDVAAAGADPVGHYLRYGCLEGRSYKFNKYKQNRRNFLEAELKACDTILEIGPFDNPVAPKYAAKASIEYVDWQTTEDLRLLAASIDERVPERVPHIDYVITDGQLEGRVPRKFDRVVSSHMVEHVPDLIFHLQQVSCVVKPDGAYVLVVPDKRHCFDHFLPASCITEVVAAHFERRRRPPLRAVIEHRAFTAGNYIAAESPLERPTATTMQKLLGAVAEFESLPYVDVHCWQFTPASLLSILNSVVALDLIAAPSSLEVFELGPEVGAKIVW